MQGTQLSLNSKRPWTVRFRLSLPLLLIFTPVLIWFIIFCYVPMYGVVIAFKDFKGWEGIVSFFTKDDWVGLKWFNDFFSSIYFWRLFKNTILLNIYNLLWSFPIPILFALLLNEVRNRLFKRTVQTVSYLPYFISTVVVIGMVVNFLSPSDGIINRGLLAIGLVEKPIHFINSPEWFRTIYITSGIWQTFGYSSIIYLAALSGVNPELYEAAEVDGAGRFRKAMHISIPGIMPTIIILLLLALGSMMSIGFEKVLLLQKPITFETSDVIATYVYRVGIKEARFGIATAVGFFNSVINIILLVFFNAVSRRVSDTSLW